MNSNAIEKWDRNGVQKGNLSFLEDFSQKYQTMQLSMIYVMERIRQSIFFREWEIIIIVC